VIKAVAATGALGTGFKAETLTRAVDGADFIGCDAGSSDPGPYYLGSGEMLASPAALSRDLELMLAAGRKHRIPVLVGSAGTAGARPQLERSVEIIRQLAAKNNWHFKLGIIDSEITTETVVEAFKGGKLIALGGAPEIDEASIAAASHVVAMQGPDCFIDALSQGADVVLAGRTSDTAIYAAIPIMRGIPKGIAFHAAKILECGAASTVERKYPDSMVSYIDHESFTVEPPNPDMVCTPQSVASHVLYETANPFRLVEPDGVLDTEHSQYEAVSDRAVRVTGSQFEDAEAYTVKLEAATLRGFREIVIGAIRDPLVIGQIDHFIDTTKAVITQKIADSLGLAPSDYVWRWSVYGKNGSMGPIEPVDRVEGHEIVLLIEILAATQPLAAAIGSITWHTVLHQPIPEYGGLVSQLAFPFSPPGVSVGAAYEFSINHAMQLDRPDATYTLTLEEM
jgi:hypothetical protein